MSDTENPTDAEVERLEKEMGGTGEQTDHLPSTGLLSFYDRLRRRVAGFVDRRGTRLGRNVADALLLLPDLFMLLLRLALDREVPAATRSLIAGALAYIVVPIDLFPEGIIGVGGFVDDVVLAIVVLSSIMSPELEAKAERYWSGSQSLRGVIRDVVGTAEAMLGVDLHEKIRRYLGRRGIEMREPSEDDGDPEMQPN